MNRIARWIIAVAVPVSMAAQEPPAPPDDSLQAVIQGTVRDSLGIAVEGASILVTPGALILRTDSSGRFVARRAPVGRVQLRIRRLGFAPLDTSIVTQVGAALTLDLRMRRLPQTLGEVVVRGVRVRECRRYTLEGVLCRREAGRGQFMNRQDIVATEAIYPMHVLRDQPGFRVNLNGDPRTVESTTRWRCMATLVDGREPSAMNPIPLVKDMFAVEVYQPDEAPPEYRSWVWRGAYPCTLIVFWSARAVQQALDRAAGIASGLTVDLTGGVLALGGGDYTKATGMALVMFLGNRRAPDPPVSEVFGATLALLGDPGSARSCDVDLDAGCRAELPFLVSLGVERGWGYPGLVSGVRFGAGAYLNAKHPGGAALGLQGQVDLAASFALLSLRGAVLPNLHGRPVALLVLTTGVRWN